MTQRACLLATAVFAFALAMTAGCIETPELQTDCESSIWGCGVDAGGGGDFPRPDLGNPSLDECNPGQRDCADSSSFIKCFQSESGAFQWSEPQPCGGSCLGDGFCCESTCSEGESLCTLDGVQRCQQQEDGCFAFSPPTPCPNGQSCAEGGGCVETCQSLCVEGEVRCDGDRYRACAEVEPGCYQLDPTLRSCPAGSACRDGACLIQCQDECPGEGDEICEANTKRRCQPSANGCLRWFDLGAACNIAPQGDPCRSFTLGREVSHNACVQTSNVNSNNPCGVSGCTWAICNDGSWSYFCNAPILGCDPANVYAHATCP